MKSKFVITILLFLSSLGISAQDVPEPMYPYRLVNDFANIFSSVENQVLEQRLLAYNDSTSTQIYVVTVTDLGGYPASDYAFALGEKWGIGQKSKNNGLVILIKPKTEDSHGQVFIATGYGLEEFINDAYTGRIIRNEMIPYFQNDDYFGGVNAAVDAVVSRLSGEFDYDVDEDEEEFPLLAVIITIIIVIIILQISFRGGDHYIDSGGHTRSGGWSSGDFGGGGSSGGSGSFGGGGGGSFGGGGAGGSW